MKFSTPLTSAVLFSVVMAPSVTAATQKPTKTASPIQRPTPDAPTPREQRMRSYMLYPQARDYEAQGDYPKAINAYKEIIQLDPRAASPHISLSEIYFQNRNLKDAETEARQAVSLEPENPAGRRLLGNILAVQSLSGVLNKEKVNEAILQFQEVARLDKADPEVYRIMGRLYQATGDADKAIEHFQKLMGSGVAKGPDFELMARLYYEKGRYRDAAQVARQAYILSDQNLRLGALLAQSLLRSGQTTEALEVYQQILTDNPNQPELLLDYAETLMLAGKYPEALQGAQKILEMDPTNVQALSILAQTQRRSGRREEAVKVLEQALKGQDVTESLQLQFELAETLIELGRVEDGVKAYQRALNALLNPDGTVGERDKRNAGVILRRIAMAYREAGQRAKAVETFGYMRKVLGDKDTLPDGMEIDLLRSEGNYAEALKIARDAQKRFPNDRQFKYLEAFSLSKLGEVNKAVELLEKMLGSNAEDADVYQTLGSLLMEAGRLEDAEKAARRALQFDQKNTESLVLLSSIQDRRKMYKESEETLRQVLAIDPDNPTALNNLGYFLTERGEKLDEALLLIQRAVNIEPTNSSFLDSLGWLYFKRSQYDQARQYIEQAIGYDGRSATQHDHLGDVYEKLGKLDQAREMWKKAVDMATDPAEIERIKTKLNASQASQKSPNK
ncbi:MAG TPA: tetratricopeptide repeat protein [Acidobacteriota bacterium]|nr:tetratricopeptide repeat protein [Acidobacteriota bacterium]